MDIDWALLKSFSDVSAYGSLSAAARATGTSQPTMSRHVSVLEQQIGSRLFDRGIDGVVLTIAGARLMQHVDEMANAAARLSMAIDGETETLSGSIRITASDVVATYVMPKILTALRIIEPHISLEMVASDRTENLLRREADIAIRMYRPEQLDVISRKVGDLEMGMFASRSYIERRGMPESLEDILLHDVIGYDRSTMIIDGFKEAGVEVDRDFFAFRSDDQVVCWEMVCAGYGLGFNQVQIGEMDPNIMRVEAAGNVGSLPVWLTVHSELNSSPRVRRVFDHLAEHLSAAI